MEIEAARTLASRVPGWVLDEEGELLFRLARSCIGRGVIVEIGSWKGRSSTWLGCGSRAGASVPIYAVDPHTGSEEHQDGTPVWTFPEFTTHIARAGLSDLVHPVVATSRDAALAFEEPIELLFIDGAHDYDSVRQDFELWAPKVVDGGVIAFHDSVEWAGFPDVVRLVEQRLYRSSSFRKVGVVASVTYGEKARRSSLSDRLRRRYALLQRRLPPAAVALVPKPAKVLAHRLLGTGS